MKSWTILAVMVAALVAFMFMAEGAFCGEKEELAIKIFTLQEEVQVSQDAFKAKQQEYVKLREQVKKEADHAKKGEAAVKILRLEEELVAMADRVNKKSAEVAEARARFKELVK